MKKVLFFGAGVLGSLYAAKFHEAGINVALVARGKRYEDITEHGVVLEQFETGKPITTPVRVLDQIPRDEYFDLCVVLIQKTQLDSALMALATNTKIPSFIFMNNSAEGPQQMIDALGRRRVLLGHVNAGGERRGHIVHYSVAEKMTIGELDGTKSQRLKEIVGVFKAAGFPMVISKDMDSWKRYHVVMGVAMATAIYMAGGCNYRLGRSREAVKKCWHAMLEGFHALQALGYPFEPPKLRLGVKLPDFIIVPLLQRVLGSKLFDIGGARHANNAREEMQQLSDELDLLIQKSGVATPTLNELQQYLDPSFPPAITD